MEKLVDRVKELEERVEELEESVEQLKAVNPGNSKKGNLV